MSRQAWEAVALAALLLVAGCAAPTHEGPTPAANGSGTPVENAGTPGKPADDAGIAVEGAGLPVDPDVVFDRVTALLGANASRPDAIRVVTPPDPDDVNASRGGGFDPAPAFFEVMDVDSDPDEGLNASEALALENGRTNLGLGTVTLFTGENDSETVHYVLAHEFVHYVQGARDRGTQLRSRLDSPYSAPPHFSPINFPSGD
ncbi:MAG: hypothetical protein ABEH66_01525 [Halobacteriales archaeon]